MSKEYPCPRCMRVLKSEAGRTLHVNAMHLELSPSQKHQASKFNGMVVSASPGLEANNYMGIPIAVDHHADGSVTLCKEVVDAIVGDAEVPHRTRTLLASERHHNNYPIKPPTLAWEMFQGYLKMQGIQLLPTQLAAAKALYSQALLNQKRGAGKTYLLRVMLDFDAKMGSSLISELMRRERGER